MPSVTRSNIAASSCSLTPTRPAAASDIQASTSTEELRDEEDFGRRAAGAGRSREMTFASKHAVTGVVLAAGAPLGWLGLRMASGAEAMAELTSAPALY